MNIVSARYQTNIQGENMSVAVDTGVSGLFVSVPMDNNNRDYQAIFVCEQEAAYEIQAAE